MSFAAGVYAGIRTGGGGSSGGGGDGQRRLFGLKKLDKQGEGGPGGGAGSGAREPKDSVSAQVGTPGAAGGGQAAVSAGGGSGGVAGCVSGGRRACAALMFHALASVPLSNRNKQEEGDERDAKADG